MTCSYSSRSHSPLYDHHSVSFGLSSPTDSEEMHLREKAQMLSWSTCFQAAFAASRAIWYVSFPRLRGTTNLVPSGKEEKVSKKEGPYVVR